MNYVLPMLTLGMCLISGVVYVRDIVDHLNGNENEEEKIPCNVYIYAAIMCCVTIIVSALLAKTCTGNREWIKNVKVLTLLSVMWPIAYIDYKSYRIPNSFIILGLLYRALILGVELLFASEQIGLILISEIIAAVALLLAAVLCALCMRNSIGFGDMKLFVVMGLFLSLDGIWSAIFMSLIVSFVIAVFLLLTKKKTRKDSIPFGPALVIGTFLSVCLSGV